MRLLLAHGADPPIATEINVAVATGSGWVEGVTFEWSEAENVEAFKMLLDMGLDPNATSLERRSPLDGAAHKGRNAVVQLLVDHGQSSTSLTSGAATPAMAIC
jgi:ankyrin repeat protein